MEFKEKPFINFKVKCKCWFGFFGRSLKEAAVVLRELHLESEAMGSSHTSAHTVST